MLRPAELAGVALDQIGALDERAPKLARTPGGEHELIELAGTVIGRALELETQRQLLDYRRRGW